MQAAPASHPITQPHRCGDRIRRLPACAGAPLPRRDRRLLGSHRVVGPPRRGARGGSPSAGRRRRQHGRHVRRRGRATRRQGGRAGAPSPAPDLPVHRPHALAPVDGGVCRGVPPHQASHAVVRRSLSGPGRRPDGPARITALRHPDRGGRAGDARRRRARSCPRRGGRVRGEASTSRRAGRRRSLRRDDSRLLRARRRAGSSEVMDHSAAALRAALE